MDEKQQIVGLMESVSLLLEAQRERMATALTNEEAQQAQQLFNHLLAYFEELKVRWKQIVDTEQINAMCNALIYGTGPRPTLH